MYERYEIHAGEAAPAAPVPNKFKPVVHRWGLLKMLVREALKYRFNKELLLSRPCIYGVFSGPVGGFWPIRSKCVGCMRCVLEHPEFCEVFIDDEFKRLGDGYFDPDSVAMLNFEATTGKIQVKGVGYKGPFTGPGFDAMWTDMSEIVRPTRDGIYGREYISTAVDIGRKPMSLAGEQSPVAEIPLPIVFDELPPVISHPSVDEAVWKASRRLGTMFVSSARPPERFWDQWIPLVGGARALKPEGLPQTVRMIECELGREFPDFKSLQARFPETVLAARIPLNGESFRRIVELHGRGWGAFHATADYHGKELGSDNPRFIKDSLLDLHRRLVREGIRDEITLIASGGIIRAEHLPKAVICGADLAALDTPVLVALHAEFRGDCTDGSGGLKTREIDPDWGAQRIVNFCAAWRNQMLEIVSAMGIRDVRRLRGETGRAMFFEDLEKEWLKA